MRRALTRRCGATGRARSSTRAPRRRCFSRAARLDARRPSASTCRRGQPAAAPAAACCTRSSARARRGAPAAAVASSPRRRSSGAPVATPMVALPIPIELSARGRRADASRSLSPTPATPRRRGSTSSLRAWRTRRPAAGGCVVTGIEPERAALPAPRGVAEPDGRRVGRLSSTATATCELLGRASCSSRPRATRTTGSRSSRRWRPARCSSPCRRGPYEALALARELDPRLVAAEVRARRCADALERRSR